MPTVSGVRAESQKKTESRCRTAAAAPHVSGKMDNRRVFFPSDTRPGFRDRGWRGARIEMNDRDAESLVRRARDRDTVALEQLLVAYYETLRAHIARRMPPNQVVSLSADDVAQEALLQAFMQIGRLREATPRVFLAWLKAVGDMSLAKCLRHQGRQKRGGHLNKIDALRGPGSDNVLNLLDELPDDAKTASSLLARQEALAALQVALAALPKDQRRAIQLHVLEDMTLEATAAKMERTLGAVRGLVQRGKENIAKSMGRASRWIGKK